MENQTWNQMKMQTYHNHNKINYFQVNTRVKHKSLDKLRWWHLSLRLEIELYILLSQNKILFLIVLALSLKALNDYILGITKKGQRKRI